jgi:hypothetical protein
MRRIMRGARNGTQYYSEGKVGRQQSPKAVAARWSRDSKQNCTVVDWRGGTFGSHRSR